MDFSPSLLAKDFYRFTGPPEHWLTAVKYMTWGLEKKYLERWKAIQPGDVFLLHSTAASQFKNAKSGIIGIGIAGTNFSTKENFLWLKEVQDQQNTWPLLVPLSEIYLFSKLPPTESWESPTVGNEAATKNLIDMLMQNSTPLSQIAGFPQMGSFSGVKKEVAMQILNDVRPLHMYTQEPDDKTVASKPTKFQKLTNAAESLRFADSLKVFDNVKRRIVDSNARTFSVDSELFAKAEDTHASVLQELLNLFRTKGYDTRYSRNVDLFAFNEKNAFLIEVKSIENRNFKKQARKGIVQLYEYDYFEVNQFVEENNMTFENRFKLLVTSKVPNDKDYVGFINDLAIGVGTMNDQKLQPAGIDLGMSKI